eukprot:9754392-Ditylum_brightwellii.AAC.1
MQETRNIQRIRSKTTGVGSNALVVFMEKKYSYTNLDTHLKLGTILWFITDSGVKGPLGSFGWVIATSTQILCNKKGIQKEIQN